MNSLDDNLKNQSTVTPKLVKAVQRQTLPDYVLQLLNTVEGMQEAFFNKNRRYVSHGYIDYLPDVLTNEKAENHLTWRYVGHDNGKKYSGAKLREMRQTEQAK